jgi:hypothetical protein
VKIVPQQTRKISRTVQTNLISLENILINKLLPIYIKMSRFGLPAEIFQNNEKLAFTLHGILRKKVQESYIIGLAAVEEIINKKIPNFELFLSITDVNYIADITRTEMIPQFWVAVNKLLQRENTIRQKKITLIEKNEFNVKAAITKFAAFVIYTAYNSAVDSKLNNILPGRTQSRTAATGINSIPFGMKIKGTITKSKTASSFTDFDPFAPDESIDDVFGDSLVLDALQEMIDNMMEMFLTKEDQDVDPAYCEPLNRAVFGIDDSDKPDPPLHPNCRCILVPVEKKVSEFFAS